MSRRRLTLVVLTLALFAAVPAHAVYTQCISLALGSSQVGLSLTAQLVDTAGANVGSGVTSGFVEYGLGNYTFCYASFPDGHRGALKFSAAATLKAIAAINPEQAENTDAKTSTRLATAGYTAPDNASVATILGRVDVATSTRSTYAGADTSGTTTLLTRVPSALTLTAGKVDVNDKTGFSLTVAPPTVAAIVAGVWDEPNASHVTAGTTGKFLSVSGMAADPLLSLVPASYASGTAGAALGLIGSGQIVTVNPLSQAGTALSLIKGDDYLALDTRALSWTDTSAAWPDLTGAAVTFTARGRNSGTEVTSAGTVVTPTGASKKVQVELTRTWTGARNPGDYGFSVHATLASGRVVTLVSGAATVALRAR